MDDLLEPPNLHDVKYDQYFSPFQFDSSADNLRVGCVIENDGTIEREVPDWRDSLFVSAEEVCILFISAFDNINMFTGHEGRCTARLDCRADIDRMALPTI